jgi:hypothetical protein
VILKCPILKLVHKLGKEIPSMKNCQVVFKIFLFLFFLACGTALIPAQERANDIILVVDVSSEMSPYYDNITNYLTGRFLIENLNLGDTFHLIAFASKPRFEIARRVLNEGDVRTINGRIFLLYPLEPSSDPGAALSYAERYMQGIPGGRQKKIFLVSGGGVESLVSAASSRLRGSGAELRFIRAPVSTAAVSRPPQSAAGTASPGGPASAGTAAPARPAAASPAVSDAAAGPVLTVQDTESAGERAEDPAAETTVETEPPVSDEETVVEPAVVIPDSPVPPMEANTVETDSAFNFGEAFSSLPAPLLIALGALILIILAVIVILMMRRLHSSPNRVIASASSVNFDAHADNSAAKNAELLNSFATHRKTASQLGPPQRRYHRDDPNQFLTNPPMLNLFVEDQNTSIGRRNVHTLKQGSTFTVGGGNSDFLIFLVPIPSRIGELRYDGNNCTFTPLKPNYFPDIGSEKVTECIGKPIRLLSDKKYEIFFHFERYRDPLIALNQLLNSISVPEPPAQEN